MNEFERVAESRGLPFAKIGMRVKFRDRYGFIFGHNHSANFNIYFDNGELANCHPHSSMTYFDDDGKVIKNFQNADITFKAGTPPEVFEIWTVDFPDDKAVIWAKSLGEAKSRYLRGMDADWIKYIDLRGRKQKYIKIMG